MNPGYCVGCKYFESFNEAYSEDEEDSWEIGFCHKNKIESTDTGEGCEQYEK